MSAKLSVSGKLASFPIKAYEFFAFSAASRAENAKGRKCILPALLYSHLPGAPVASRSIPKRSGVDSSRAVSSRQAGSFYHLKKGADTFGNIFFLGNDARSVTLSFELTGGASGEGEYWGAQPENQALYLSCMQ